MYPIRSAKHRGAPSKKWATLSTQCLSCLKYTIEGTVYCLCGKCLMPSPEQTDKIKNRIDITSNPLYTMKEGHTGERHGPKQWQYEHWKAKDATEGAKKRRYKPIEHRWLTDIAFRESKLSHGWTLEYCKYSDNFKTVNMDYIATWEERDRYQNMLVLRYTDGKNHGKMSTRDDFKLAARSFAVASNQGGKRHFYILRGGRLRQRPLIAQLEADLEWRSHHLHLRQPGGKTDTGIGGIQQMAGTQLRKMAQPRLVERVMATDAFCRQDTHSQDTSVQYSLITARTAHSMRLAWLKFKTKRDLQASLCPKITLCTKIRVLVIWCVACLIHSCSLTRLPP